MAEVTLNKAPKKVQDLFNRGFSAIERGNLDYAMDVLFTCLQMEPGLLQARKFLRAAEIQKFKQKKSNLLTHIIPAITGLPTYLSTMAMMKSGKTGQALVSAEKLLRNDPLNPKFIRIFAQAAANADLPEAAIQTLEIARDHRPNDVSLINLLGTLYQEVGQTRLARQCFERLCEICPNDLDALRSLKDVLALDSMSKDGWAEAAEKDGTYREMIKDTKEATLLEQEAKAVKSGKDSSALIANILEKIEAEPENVNYYRTLAGLYSGSKMFGDAIATLEKALTISPGDPELNNALSSTRIQQFDHEISELKATGDTAGAAAKEAERNQFVFDDLQERVRRYPNDLTLRYDWGVMLYENDYLNEAIEQFQMAQKSPKHRVRSLYYLGMCFKQKKQYDLALEQLEKAASEISTMDEMKKDILYELGGISESLGDQEKAAKYYKQIYQVDIGYRDIVEKIEKVYKTREA